MSERIYRVWLTHFSDRVELVSAAVTKVTTSRVYFDGRPSAFGCRVSIDRAEAHFTPDEAIRAFVRQKEREIEQLEKDAAEAGALIRKAIELSQQEPQP